MDWLKMLAIAGMNGGGSGGSGGVSPEEVTTIVKEQFPGGVGYSEVGEVEIYRNEEIDSGNWQYNAYMDFMPTLKVGYKYRCEVDGTVYEAVAEAVEGGGVEALLVEKNDDDDFMTLTNVASANGMTVFTSSKRFRPKNTLVVTEIGEKVKTINPKFLPEHLRFGGTPEKYFEWGGAYTDTGDNFIHGITVTSPDTGETMEAPVAYAKLTDEIVSRKQLVGDGTTSGTMRANGTTYPVVIEDSFVYSSGTYQMVMTPYGNGPLLFSGPKGVAVFSVTLDGAEMQLSCNLPSDGTYVYAMDGDEVYALSTAEDITPISAKYMPKVADLSGTWIADLKAALGI